MSGWKIQFPKFLPVSDLIIPRLILSLSHFVLWPLPTHIQILLPLLNDKLWIDQIDGLWNATEIFVVMVLLLFFFCLWLNWHSRLSKNNSANFMWHLLLVAPSLIQFKVVSELNMFWLKSKSQLLKEKEEFSQLEKVQTISIQQFPNNFGHFCFWLSETYKWPQSLFCWKTQPKSNPRHLIRMIMIPNQPTKRPWQRQRKGYLENKNKCLGVKLTFFQRAHQGQMRTQ